MKISHFTLMTCLALTGAVSDMTVVIRRGENATLLAITPDMKEINRVTLWNRYENGTLVPFLRWCSIKEKLRGCTDIDDRLHLQPGSESLILLGAKATDAGAHILEVIGNHTIKKTLDIVFNESSGSTSTTVSPPSEDNTVTIVIAVLIIMVVVTVYAAYIKRKTGRSLISLTSQWIQKRRTLNQASLEQMNTNASSGERCLVEKKPKTLTAPIQMHII